MANQSGLIYRVAYGALAVGLLTSAVVVQAEIYAGAQFNIMKID